MIDGGHPVENHVGPPQISLQTRVNPCANFGDFLFVAGAIGPVIEGFFEEGEPYVVLFESCAFGIGCEEVVRSADGDFEAEVAESAAEREFGCKENCKGRVLFEAFL
jgi:hypothetical protein